MQTKQTKQKDENNKVEPTNKFVIFPITITEWKNNNIKSYTISKSYKDENNEWQNTTSFNEADLCVIEKILKQI